MELSLETFPNEILANIFEYVITTRTKCRKLVRLDNHPHLRKKYPRGEYGWTKRDPVFGLI